MEPSSDNVLVLTDRHGPGKRAVLVATGSAAVVLPVLDLWRGLWPPSIVSPFFAVIVFGAMAVGLVLIVAGVFGDSTDMRLLPDGRAVLERRNLVRRRREVLAAGEITGVTVTEHAWEGQRPTFSLRVTQAHGRPVSSQEVPTRAEAEALADRVRRVAGLA